MVALWVDESQHTWIELISAHNRSELYSKHFVPQIKETLYSIHYWILRSSHLPRFGEKTTNTIACNEPSGLAKTTNII